MQIFLPGKRERTVALKIGMEKGPGVFDMARSVERNDNVEVEGSPIFYGTSTTDAITPVSINNERMTMKLSARNNLKGKIVEVTKGQTTAHVRIDIGGSIVTASITNEAVDELKLAAGQSAYAVIKASDVMVAID
jgi:molybdopterin-binding protein